MRLSKPEPPPCFSSAAKLSEIEFTQCRSSAAQKPESVISPTRQKKTRTWCSVTLPLENMPEVTPTSSTDDLGAFDSSRKVHIASYSARDGWMQGQTSLVNNTARHTSRKPVTYRRKRLASHSRCRTWWCSYREACCNPRRNRPRPRCYARTPRYRRALYPSNAAP